MWGFITGGLVWFSIPFTLATTMGLAYLGLSSAQGQPMLSDEDVMKVNFAKCEVLPYPCLLHDFETLKSTHNVNQRRVWLLRWWPRSCWAAPGSTRCSSSS